MSISELHQLYLNSNTITTDTRTILKGSIFFALKGVNFNGNNFANDALKKGASYVVLDEFIEKKHKHSQYIIVDNVLATLQQLASFHRKFLDIPIIGITGSNGKTTTKELINSVLSQSFKVTATVGNLNNHIGVPLTLLTMTKDTEIGIIEMGANHQKEIKSLCQIAQPNFGYITNFGKAHLEGFGGFEGVIIGKSELYDYLRDHQQRVFVNINDRLQVEKSEGINTITFGDSSNAQTRITLDQINPFVSAKCEDTLINSQLIGRYNFNNIAAAIAIGNHFNININTIKKGIENYTPNNNRSQIIKKKTNEIILDAYNANPSSIEVAIDNFTSLSSQQKTVILGDMFELGETSKQEHYHIIKKAIGENFNTTIFIGAHFYAHKANFSKGIFFRDFDTFKNTFNTKSIKNQFILIKGSRGMALERILKLF